MTWLIAALIIFAAVLTQSLVGFGSAMIAMALLSTRLGLGVAAPLVALVALTLEAVMLVRLRRALSFSAVWRLSLGALAGVPLGVLALRRVPEQWTLAVLGAVLIAYAVYALLRYKLPELRQSGWAYGAGALAGLLGGAYNTSGPPVIIYADCRRWSPAEFKSNLQGFFVFSDLLVIVSHAVAGNLVPLVWTHYLTALPAIALGLALGVALEPRVSPSAFRKAALILLLILGLRLLWPLL